MSLEDIAVTAALILILLALVGWASGKLAEYKNPPVGRVLNVDGLDLHYLDIGQGEPVVLLHGNVTMIQDYSTSGVIDSLEQNYRVIAFDRPGFGYSARPRGKKWTAARQAQLIAGAMKQLGISSAVVVGHSWGTLVAVALAQTEPALIRSLVLLSGYYYPKARPDILLAKIPAMPVVGDILRYTVSPVAGLLMMPVMLRAMFGPPRVPQRFKRDFPMSMMLRPWQIRAAAEDGAIMNEEASTLQPGYKSMRMPVIVMAGGDDRIVSADAHSVRLQTQLPNSEVEVVPSIGHMIHHSATDRVVAAVIRAVGAQSRLEGGHTSEFSNRRGFSI